MKTYAATFWDDMYREKEFRYGKNPNLFFKSQIDKLQPANMLLPAEGEGRNAVYAASQGWKVTAFDISEQGQIKAQGLAKENCVKITYNVANVLEFQSSEKFDVIGLSYAHFPADIRQEAHQYLLTFLKPNGYVILEAFSKAQLGNPSGGPKNENMLFSIEDIRDEFTQLEFELLEEKTIDLSEGDFHKGKANVIRFLGQHILM
jgi:SAM-dependent methyltransferase